LASSRDSCMSGILGCGSIRNCAILPYRIRFPGDCREGWQVVCATVLIIGDDVTGRAPVPSQLLAAGRFAGHRGRARDRSAEAKSKRRVTPKG
jgi:hypothetical protein